jgi:GNAT superfamily N-acetyltransferase
VTLTVKALDPTDVVGLKAWYDVQAAAGRHDVPDFPVESLRRHMVRLAKPWPNMTERALLASADDAVVGFASATLPSLENTGTLYLDLRVHPDHRRRGIGTRLLEEIYAIARDHQRDLIEIQTVAALPGGIARDEAGKAFVGRLADAPALHEVRRRWSADRAPAAIEQLAVGYSLVYWRDRSPDDIVDGIAALDSRLILDAPMGDLQVEPEKFDVERVRATEAARRDRGDHFYCAAARHDATGAVVAYTMISFDNGIDDHAWQQITIVDPQHRGRRLGLAVKQANQEYVRSHEPLLRDIDTWNAESNTHMIAVNEQLGYRPVDAWQIWQVPVPSANDGS